MNISVILKTLLLLSTLIDTSWSIAETRIFGGAIAKPGQFPFIASLRVYKEHICAGSIISSRWIVSAAHCLGTKRTIAALVGTISQKEGGVEYETTRVIKHREYNITNHLNDIGVLKTMQEIKFNRLVRPVELDFVREGATVLAAGWGLTKDLKISPLLKFIEMRVMNQETCKATAERDGDVVWEKNVCTVGIVGQGTCYADSGGPLVADGKLVGLLSYGRMPCAKGHPDIFTRTLSYNCWLNMHAFEDT